MDEKDSFEIWEKPADDAFTEWSQEGPKLNIKDLLKDKSKDSLGDRMKEYEYVERKFLTRRMPTIIRIDGKAFHSFTKGFNKPFDNVLMQSMYETAQYLCENIMGCKIAYTQSDEITLLITDYDELTTQAWFNKNVQKMVSISASMATMAFNNAFRYNVSKFLPSTKPYSSNPADHPDFIHSKKLGTAMFDSRVYNLPKEEVCNCFIWRQQDATRNAIQMVGQANFSHKQLQNKSCNLIQEMLFQEKGINFNDLPTAQKRGVCIIKESFIKDNVTRSRWIVDNNIPIFTQERNYIERLL